MNGRITTFLDRDTSSALVAIALSRLSQMISAYRRFAMSVTNAVVMVTLSAILHKLTGECRSVNHDGGGEAIEVHDHGIQPF